MRKSLWQTKWLFLGQYTAIHITLFQLLLYCMQFKSYEEGGGGLRTAQEKVVVVSLPRTKKRTTAAFLSFLLYGRNFAQWSLCRMYFGWTATHIYVRPRHVQQSCSSLIQWTDRPTPSSSFSFGFFVQLDKYLILAILLIYNLFYRVHYYECSARRKPRRSVFEQK